MGSRLTGRLRVHSGSLRKFAGFVALALAALSSLCALGIRDSTVATGMIFFGIPWLLRLMLVVIAWCLLRQQPRKWRIILLLLAVHSLVQAGQSFRWRDDPPVLATSFGVTLWNAGRNLWKMQRAWPDLAGPDTKLVVLIEAGPFPGKSWQDFTATHPNLTWRRLEGGIVVGAKGKWLDVAELGDRPRFRCHRVRVEIDGSEYTVLAVDIPSQPWLPRQPYLDRIRTVASDRRCLILGDFNTPESASGFDAWRPKYVLANDAKPRGFRETWCYGLPVLTLDQLWLSQDLKAVSASQIVSLRSDHVRMTFQVEPR
jgi:hypothetical protein